MRTALSIASGILVVAFAAAPLSVPAQAKTMKECAAQWKEMKAAGQTNGMKYRDFSKQCMSEGGAATETPPATKPEAAAPPAAAPTGNAVFPTAVSPKYAKEPAGKARRETCLDQYKANKATGANGGLKWIQKGGGYYSECNKRLKGAA